MQTIGGILMAVEQRSLVRTGIAAEGTRCVRGLLYFPAVRDD